MTERRATQGSGQILCLATPIRRSPPIPSGGNAPPPAADCSGSWDLDLNSYLFAQPGPHAGDTLTLQGWGTDPGLPPPVDSQLSDALEVVLMP